MLEFSFSENTPDNKLFIEVIVPLALPNTFTYSVPAHLKASIQTGIRVEVPFGKQKRYAAIVKSIGTAAPKNYEAKPILDVLDAVPIVTQKQFELWEWMSSYYISPIGAVMDAALPAGFKLDSETTVVLRPGLEEQDLSFYELPPKEYIIVEALLNRTELNMDDLRKLLQQKTVTTHVQRLIDKQLIFIKSTLKEKYKPKLIDMVMLSAAYEVPNGLQLAFEKIGTRSVKQAEVLMAFVQLSQQLDEIPKKALFELAGINQARLKPLIEKGILELYQSSISRINLYDGNLIGKYALSSAQKQALLEVKAVFQQKATCLLHGVTGSGKTQLFVELIEEYIGQGKQVLYLLPEIALTAQIVSRLQVYFGDKIVVYHSKFNSNERVEIWDAVLQGTPIILGARSALFMPFKDLGLIIVDEEHDPSYKQKDPSPRYNARDTSIYLAHQFGAKVLLGTATPSLESYINAKKGKYGLVELKERFGGIQLPKIKIIDAATERRKKRMKSIFTQQLLDEIKLMLSQKKQIILFQNRRGYAPIYSCTSCDWKAGCVSCDVRLTYHKFTNDLHCHYCNFHQKLPKACPSCGLNTLIIQGFGTEKIEDELQVFLPDARIARMDWDTVKGKHGHEKLIQKFTAHEIDILVGTQMITKGLDFDNVGLVGVLDADQMLHFPNFRATERAFQLMLQVSGRAGRKKEQGTVLIQAFTPNHPVLKEVQLNQFDQFFSREMQERSEFGYPPFLRIIQVQLRHKKQEIVEQAAQLFVHYLKSRVKSPVLGPSTPGVSRIRNYYLRDLLLKIPNGGTQLQYTKTLLLNIENHIKRQKGFGSLRVILDVDPY